MPRMTYLEALALLQRESRPGMVLGLERIRALCTALGEPQRGRLGVLVAGTNGKGSVCAMVDAMARAAGHRTVLLTKPHLSSYRERIRLDGVPVSTDRFAALAAACLEAAERVPDAVGRPTHHELLTAMGLLAAREADSQVLVCEVGLGGRLDATNVYDGGIAAITSVSLDHQAQLGPTPEAICREKAAIIKEGNTLVAGVDPSLWPIVCEAAAPRNATVWALGRELRVADVEVDGEAGWGVRCHIRTPARDLPRLRVALAGRFQAENAAVAVGVADALGARGRTVDDAAVRAGLAAVRWPGRLDLQPGRPPILIDSGHNPGAIAAVLPSLERFAAGRRTVMVFGAMADKDHPAMLAQLARLPVAAAVFTAAASPRAAGPDTVAAAWPRPCEVEAGVARALERARALAGPDGGVVVCGSVYVAGEALSALGAGPAPDPVAATTP